MQAPKIRFFTYSVIFEFNYESESISFYGTFDRFWITGFRAATADQVAFLVYCTFQTSKMEWCIFWLISDAWLLLACFFNFLSSSVRSLAQCRYVERNITQGCETIPDTGCIRSHHYCPLPSYFGNPLNLSATSLYLSTFCHLSCIVSIFNLLSEAELLFN